MSTLDEDAERRFNALTERQKRRRESDMAILVTSQKHAKQSIAALLRKPEQAVVGKKREKKVKP